MRNNKNVVMCLAVLVILTGCNSVKMRVESDSNKNKSDQEYTYSVKAYSSFWNLKNTSIQKTPKEVIVQKKAGLQENTKRTFVVTDGTDFVGSKNKSVTYHVTYWDSVIAVFSLGFYVPISIEYVPTKNIAIPD